MIRNLLQQGKDINAKNRAGQTALDIAKANWLNLSVWGSVASLGVKAKFGDSVCKIRPLPR